jgi:type I restriction enzyme S subunit
MKNISQPDIRALQVPCPPVARQKEIAEILASVDESVRSVKQFTGKLEATRNATVLESLQEGEKKILRAEENWTPFRLSDLLICPPKNGYSPKEVDAYTGTLMLGLGCLTPSGFSPRQLKNAPARDLAVRRAMLADGDLLISRANTRDLVGFVGTFKDLGVPCIYPDLMMRLRPNHLIRTQFLEILLRSPSTRQQIQAQAVGTSESMVKINASIVLNLKISVPDLQEQDRILATVVAFDSRLDALAQELNKLQHLKQGLMADLLTGRMRMKAGEA